MKKIVILFAFLPLLSVAQDKAKTFKLNGKMSNLAMTPEWIYLQYRSNGEWKTDSVKPENGSYSFEGQILEPSISQLRVKYVDTEPGKKVVVIEDLVSTGKSSLQVVDVLQNAGLEVAGMVSIFTYGFPQAETAFSSYNLKYKSLTNYPTLISLAIEKGIVSPDQTEVLLKWRDDPSNWKGI